MSSSKPPGPSRAEIALQQQQTMALGSQTALLEQQAARQEEQYRQQNLLAPLLYEQMGLRPQYNEQGQITGYERFETPEQQLYKEQIQAQLRARPQEEALQQRYMTLAEQQAAFQERQQPGQERLQALYLDIAEQQAKAQQLEAAWQQETAPQRKAQIEAELRLQQQTVQYQETALRQYQEQQKMQPLLYEEAGVRPIYDEAGNITSFARTEQGQKRLDYESQLLEHQRKALAGELPVDPTLERTLKEGETQLRSQLQAQLGEGYETSTPGIQALGEFSRKAAEARANVAHGQLVSGQQLLESQEQVGARQQAGASSGRGMLGDYGLRPVSFGQGVQAGGMPNYLGTAQGMGGNLFTAGGPTLTSAGYQTAVNSPYGTLGQFGDLAQRYGGLVSSGGTLVNQLAGRRRQQYQDYQAGAAQSGGIWGTGLGIVGAAAGAYFGGPAGASAGWTLGSAAGQQIGRATY